jgi:hypothetical protein
VGGSSFYAGNKLHLTSAGNIITSAVCVVFLLLRVVMVMVKMVARTARRFVVAMSLCRQEAVKGRSEGGVGGLRRLVSSPRTTPPPPLPPSRFTCTQHAANTPKTPTHQHAPTHPSTTPNNDSATWTPWHVCYRGVRSATIAPLLRHHRTHACACTCIPTCIPVPGLAWPGLS